MKDTLNGDFRPDWAKTWDQAGMPEYNQQDIEPYQSIKMNFMNIKDREDFIKLVNQPKTTFKTNYLWFPQVDKQQWSQRNAAPSQVPPNKYPIYIISKGRYDSNVTARNLEKLGIVYWLVVEPQERDRYVQAGVTDPKRILALPSENYGGGCSIPARNWCWEHSIKKLGAERHWILDDNIGGFYCLNKNMKPKVTSANPFIKMEEFTDAHKNIGISGPNYEFFTQRRTAMPPYYPNTRVYSCILIRNDLPFRWRGRYNEDTDLCLRVLKSGLATVLFNYYQAKKVTTMIMKGGNTDVLYQEDGRLKMAQSLRDQHPDVVKITRKWGRWQHNVNYKPFAGNRLVPR